MLEFRYIFGENGYKIAADFRKKVFSDEMGMTEITDAFDEKSYHFVGYDKTVQVAVARLTQFDEKNFSIAYVAIKEDYRRQFVGDLVMRALADKAVALGGTTITLEAPVQVRGFFEYEGYESFGDAYLVDGIPFVKMVKDLTKVESHCKGCGK